MYFAIQSHPQRKSISVAVFDFDRVHRFWLDRVQNIQSQLDEIWDDGFDISTTVYENLDAAIDSTN